MIRTPRQLRVELSEDLPPDLVRVVSEAGDALAPLLDDVESDVEPDEDEENVADQFSSTRNLTSTILGAGILSIPYAVAESGVIVGVLLLGLTALLSTISCNLILSSYLRTGRGSYGDLAYLLMGRNASLVVKWVIILLSIGAVSGYILVVRDLLPASVCQITGKSSLFCTSDSFMTGVVVFGIVFPLCCLENLSSLRHTSMLAFGFAIFLTFAISFRSIEFSPKYCEVRMLPEDVGGVFRALPLFCFSFVCHLNVLPVYDQLRKRSPSRMRVVFRNAIFFALSLYSIAGVFGYLRFSCSPFGVPPNILEFGEGRFPEHDLLIAAARIAEAFTCTLALPLIQHPNRVAIHSLIFSSNKFEDGHNDDDANANDEEESTRVLRAIKVKLKNARIIRAVESLGFLSLAFSLALNVPSVKTVFGFMGASFCAIIVFILPGLFYLQATKELCERVHFSEAEENSLRHVQAQRIVAFCLIAFGTMVAVLGTLATALDT